MPQKNSVKIYYENGFYHVYNRGVEKRDIFCDRGDYLVMQNLLKGALTPASKETLQGSTLQMEGEYGPRKFSFRPRMNFNGKIDLAAYSLMPNHYHFLLRQAIANGVTEFIRSIFTSYTMYFNKKYDRVGSLFQSVFKAVNVDNENYLLWVSRYIHRNPADFKNYSYSSYDDYLGKRKTPWVNSQLVLDYFSSKKARQVGNYQEFVEAEKENPIEIFGLYLEED